MIQMTWMHDIKKKSQSGNTDCFILTSCTTSQLTLTWMDFTDADSDTCKHDRSCSIDTLSRTHRPSPLRLMNFSIFFFSFFFSFRVLLWLWTRLSAGMDIKGRPVPPRLCSSGDPHLASINPKSELIIPRAHQVLGCPTACPTGYGPFFLQSSHN
jgi:hypothetical protein